MGMGLMAITYSGAGVGGAIQAGVDVWTPAKAELIRGDLNTLDAAISALDTRVDVLETGVQLFQASIVLTDAQNKALPTTPVVIQAAPGSGYIFEPLWARLVMRSAGGAYTNINAAAWLTIEHATAPYPLMSYLANDVAITNGSATRVSALFGAAATNRVVLVPHQDSENVNDWGLLSGVHPHLNGENKALQLSFDNNGSGNLTGGNAANTLTATVLYMKVPI